MPNRPDNDENIASFFPRTRRRKQILPKEMTSDVSLGNLQYWELLAHVQKAVTEFLVVTLGVEATDIRIRRAEVPDTRAFGSTGPLLPIDEGSLAVFEVRETPTSLLQFRINRIPCRPTATYFRAFIESLRDVLNIFYGDLERLSERIDQNNPTSRVASKDMMHRADWFLENLSNNVICEYIFSLFADLDENYEFENVPFARSPYEYDLISRALRFANELSTRSIESQPVSCGFVFHIDPASAIRNSVESIKLVESIPFGSFRRLKSLLQISDGRSVFFNVSGGDITGFFVTRDPVVEIEPEPSVDQGKTFEDRPLIISVQGYGNIFVLEGRQDKNALILHIRNSVPRLIDLCFVEERLITALSAILSGTVNIQVVSKWLLKLATGGHGTTIVISPSGVPATGVIKAVAVEAQPFVLGTFSGPELTLLNGLTQPDGALFFDQDWRLLCIGAILASAPPTDTPVLSQVMGGGARHTSALRFSENNPDCLVIVVSEDGPISVFKGGNTRLHT